jgi:hypothetical protein
MNKITINKTVYWAAGERMMSGQVKQVMSDHVLVKSAGLQYLVNKTALSVKPVGKFASIVYAAGPSGKDEVSNVKLRINLKAGICKVELEGGKTPGGCSRQKHPWIGVVEDAFAKISKATQTEARPEIRPERPAVKPIEQELPPQAQPQEPEQLFL